MLHRVNCGNVVHCHDFLLQKWLSVS